MQYIGESNELKSLKFKKLGQADELKSLKFKKLGQADELKSLKFKKLGQADELKSLKFKKLGQAGELKSLKFKKNLGKTAPEHVRSSRILDKNAFSLTKLGTVAGRTSASSLPIGIKILFTAMLIAFLVFRLKSMKK